MFFIFKTVLAIVFIVAIFTLAPTVPSEQSADLPSPVADEIVKTKLLEVELPKTDKIILETKKDPVLEKEVIKTEPLRVIKEEIKIETSFLTLKGIISWTNFFRQTNNLLPLKESENLNSIAQSKLEDMLNRQYFEHVSPSGEGAGDLAKKFGYKFVLIGENLAMGDFVDDEDVVKAWMNSPGHKANILKPSYVEIGVATKKGFFNGREVWMSVQIFAVPLSFCNEPGEGLLEKIESNKAQLKSTKEHLDLLQNVIKEEKYQTREEYEKLVAEHNSLIPSHNFLSQNTKLLIEQYNQGVTSFNQCVDSIE